MTNKVIREIRNKVNNPDENIDLTIISIVDELLTKVLGKDYTFPINIRKIAKELNITIDFVEYPSEQINSKIMITIDEDYDIPEEIMPKFGLLINRKIDRKKERYIIAKTIAEYLCYNGGTTDIIYINTFDIVTIQIDEIVNMIALELLIPFKCMLNLYKNSAKIDTDYIYIDGAEAELGISDSAWYNYLSEIAIAPFEDTIFRIANSSRVTRKLIDMIINKEKEKECSLEKDKLTDILNYFKNNIDIIKITNTYERK